MKLFILVILSVITFAGIAQRPCRLDWDFEDSTSLTSINVNDTNISVVILKCFVSKELIYENDNLVEYFLLHKKVKLLTDKGITEYNKIYIPLSTESEMVIEKARLINSQGEIKELSKADIKEATDEESERKYRYFAIDGADINSEVEYIFMFKQSPSYRGDLYTVQSEDPQKNYSFEMIIPNDYGYTFKSYNGLPEITRDSAFVPRSKVRWYLNMDTVPPLKEPLVSAYEAHLMKFGYKLTWSNYSRTADISSFGELSETIHSYLFTSVTKPEAKLFNKILKDIDLEDKSDEEKIRAIENYVKSNLYISDYSFPSDMDVTKLWKIKIANETITGKILANLFKQANIKFETGFTCDRFEKKFDPKFELWTYTDDIIFYFPTIDKYTTTQDYDRLGYPDYNLISNYGLFVKDIKVGDQSYGVGEVKFIPHNDYLLSCDTLKINADIAATGFEDAVFDIYHAVFGYKADVYQIVYEMIDDEEFKETLRNSLIEFISEDVEITDSVFEGFNSNLYGVKSATVKAKFTSPAFFEKAQDKTLFKIGVLIGPQMEFYESEQRTIPVEDAYAKNYLREISFTIPDGYRVANLDDLILNESFANKDGKTEMAFTSTYTIDGNRVNVVVHEYYTEVVRSLDIYDDYRTVVNAAADFNKIVLIFEKE